MSNSYHNVYGHGSFDNSVPNDNSNNYNCSGIMLEPRLQEYLKRVKMNRKTPVYDKHILEKQYRITSEDKSKLRAFMKGDRDIYDKKYREKESSKKVMRDQIRRMQGRQQQFDSYKLGLHDDKRVPKQKQKKHHQVPTNRGMFAPDMGKSSYDEEQIDIMNATPLMDNRMFTDNYNDLAKYSNDSWGYTPKNSMFSDPSFSQQTLNNIKSGNIYQDNSKGYKPYHSGYSGCRTDNNQMINQMYQSNKRFGEDVDMYQRDREFDTYVQAGMPTFNKKKSYGYPDTWQYHFNYAPLELQDPDHVVMNFPRGGDSTRLANGVRNKIKSREVMP